MKYLSLSILSLILVISVAAQGSCSAFVDLALESIDDTCQGVSRNEICYGHSRVSIESDNAEIEFSQPGDIASLIDVQSIEASAYLEPDEWGLALMQVQANIPDTLPGQNVTFLLYGDVSLRNADAPSITLSATVAGNANVRSGSSTSSAIAGSLSANTEIELSGRNEAGDWVYFTGGSLSGWLFASLAQIDGDVMTLAVVADDYTGEVISSPMQAIYFTSGIGQYECNEIPSDGLLIQTPDYELPIELRINETEIILGSTILVTADAGNLMTIYVLEGFAFVTANGVTVNVPQGAVVTIPIDTDARATGTPSIASSYLSEDVDSTPVDPLPEDIMISEPVSAADLEAANHPIVGQWIGSQSDASVLTAVFIPTGGNTYREVFTDTLSAADGPCGGTSYVGSSQGVVVDNVFMGTTTVVCANGATSTNTFPVVYDPATDTLTISEVFVTYRRR